jgi:sugar-specific transcriptional regulator TrmB
MIENVLKKIGLESKEISVYLKSLDLGSQPASVVAMRVGVPRNTTRFILDKLVRKGLVSKSKRGNTQIYTPEHPQNVVRFVESKRTKMNDKYDIQRKAIEDVMVELESKMRPTSTRPKITFYEGEEGMEKVYDDTLTSSETIRSFASFEGMHGALPEYFQTYYKRRAGNKIFIRSIHPDTPFARERTKNDKEEWRESRLIPIEKYNFDPEIQFYDNKVNIASWKEKLGVIIESEEIYQTMVVAFELAWNEASRLDKRKRKK